MNQKWTVRDLAEMALVAAIYIVLAVTPPFNVLSFGAVQFRIAEMMNFLAFYDRKHIWSVTIGCMIANYIGFGLVDVFVGGGSTLVFLSIGVALFSRYTKERLVGGLFNKAFLAFSVFFSISMVTIALELHLLYQAPFLLTWLTTGLGELGSLLLGSLLIEKVAKRFSW